MTPENTKAGAPDGQPAKPPAPVVVAPACPPVKRGLVAVVDLLEQPEQTALVAALCEVGLISEAGQPGDGGLEFVDHLCRTIGPDSSVFSEPAHRQIYETLYNLWRDDKPLSSVSLLSELLRSGRRHLVPLASRYADRWVPAELGREAVNKLLEQARRRTLKDRLRTLVAKADSGEVPLDALQAELQELPRALQLDHNGQDGPDYRLPYNTALAGLESFGPQAPLLPPTGWPTLDRWLRGLQPGQLVLVGGRPSVGKTAFLLDWFYRWSEAGLPMLFVSCEMPPVQIGARLDRRHLDLEKDRLTNAEQSAAVHQMDNLARWRSLFEYPPTPTVGDLTALLRRAESERGAKRQVLFVDYLQLLRPGARYENRNQEVAEISRQLKSLARAENVLVVVASQLSRAPETRGGKPRLSDLRDSGALEQDADVVLLLSAAEDQPPEPGCRALDLDVAKNRNGPTDLVRLLFWPARNRFEEAAEAEPAHPTQPAPQPALEPAPAPPEVHTQPTVSVALNPDLPAQPAPPAPKPAPAPPQPDLAQLKIDCAAVFQQKNVDFLPSAELVKALRHQPDSPWAGRKLSEKKLARWLAPANIKPCLRYVNGRRVRGYPRAAFELRLTALSARTAGVTIWSGLVTHPQTGLILAPVARSR